MFKENPVFKRVFKISILIAVSIFAHSGSLSATPSTSSDIRFKLNPCNIRGINQDVLCGTYEVFENRETKAGRRIALNIVVLPAKSSTPAPDPLFVLVGGPGQAATLGASGNWRRFDSIRSERDIVLVDQRGTGKSNRLHCDLGGTMGAVQAFVAGEFPVDKVAECRETLSKKADLRMYSTPIAMDDLNEVREWLGYEKINLYGGSYGTRPAMVFARRHPEHVRTITVRGVYSMDPLYFARDADRALRLVLDDCKADESCNSKYPNLSATLTSLLAKLDRDPGEVTIFNRRSGASYVVKVDRSVFIGAIRRMLYASSAQRLIPRLIHSGTRGNFQELESVVAQTSSILNGFSIGMFLSVACPEGFSGPGLAEIEKASSGTYFKNYMAKSAVATCKAWGLESLPRSYFDIVQSDKPVLILSGELDPVTPPSWGERIRKGLKNSVHLRMKGIAHSPFPGCALRIMSDFVKAGSIRSLDTACIGKLKRSSFVLPPSVAPISTLPDDEDEREIVEQEHKWLDLTANFDGNGLLEFLPAEFTQTEIEQGKKIVENKSRWIANVVRTTGGVENGEFKLGDYKFERKEGAIEIVTSWSFSGIVRGRKIASTIGVRDTWKKLNGRWKPVSRTFTGR